MVMSMRPLVWITALAALGALAAIIARDDTATTTTTTEPIPHLSPDTRVLLLGDSIGVGLASHLAKLLPGPFTSRVLTGRTAQGAISALAGDEQSYDIVLLSLGSNDALLVPSRTDAALRELVQQIGPERLVWIPPPGFSYGTTASPSGAAAFTTLIHELGVRMVSPSPVPPAPDDPMRLHLAPSGYRAFAEQIVSELA